jgi:general secretion pathway protein A
MQAANFSASSNSSGGIDIEPANLSSGRRSVIARHASSQPLLCVVPVGNARLVEKLRREELIPLGSCIGTRREALLACLDHLTDGAGNEAHNIKHRLCGGI